MGTRLLAVRDCDFRVAFAVIFIDTMQERQTESRACVAAQARWRVQQRTGAHQCLALCTCKEIPIMIEFAAGVRPRWTERR